MADIITFKTKEASVVKELLEEILKNSDTIEDFAIMVKDKDGLNTLLHTGLSLADKSVFIQLLQHDIFQDLHQTTEVEFEPDL